MDEPRFRARGPGFVEGIAPAKLNLFLEVVARRSDGYHELATVFHEIDFGDELRVELAPGAAKDRLELHGLAIDGDPAENLALRAVRAYRQRRPATPPVRIVLRKLVPPGTGMGGGSADAAFVLRALQSLVAPLDRNVAADIARELGADVGFLLQGGTAIGRGRGDELEPLSGFRPWVFLLALSPFAIATARAYGAVDLNAPRSDVLSAIVRLRERDCPTGFASCFNRLESAACRIEPRLAETLRWLRENTRRHWAMTGSGSAVFAPMISEFEAAAVRDELQGRRDLDLRIVRSFDRQLGKQCT